MNERVVAGYEYKKPRDTLIICPQCLDKEPGLDPDWAEPWYDDEDDWDYPPSQCHFCGKLL